MEKRKMTGLAIVLSFICGVLALGFAVGDLRLILLGKFNLDKWIPFLPTFVLLFFMYVIRKVDELGNRL